MHDWPFDPLIPLRYGSILIDYPWAYEMRTANGHAKSPEAHYQTMPLPQGRALPVGQLAAPDCILFMWSTWPHLPAALDLMDTWGFRYVTAGAWIKRTKNWKLVFGTGYTLHGASEPFLVGKIGAPKIVSRSERNVIDAPLECVIDDTIEALRREHSRKPDQMRAMIERLLPDVPKCELFAREAWPGHAVWGNETSKFEGDEANDG